MKLYDDIWTKRWKDVRPSVSQSTLGLIVGKHDVEIITHRPKAHEPYLREWLDFYFPDLSQQLRIRITDTTEEKAFYGHDILFDDAPPLVEALIKKGNPKPFLFLVEQPWNLKEDYGKHGDIVRRVKTLKEGIELLASQ